MVASTCGRRRPCRRPVRASGHSMRRRHHRSGTAGCLEDRPGRGGVSRPGLQERPRCPLPTPQGRTPAPRACLSPPGGTPRWEGRCCRSRSLRASALPETQRRGQGYLQDRGPGHACPPAAGLARRRNVPTGHISSRSVMACADWRQRLGRAVPRTLRDTAASAQAILVAAARSPGRRLGGRLPQPCGRTPAPCRSRMPSGASPAVRGLYWRSPSSEIYTGAQRKLSDVY